MVVTEEVTRHMTEGNDNMVTCKNMMCKVEGWMDLAC